MRAILIWMGYAATRVMVTSRPKRLPKTISGSMVQLKLGFVLISMTCFTQKGIGTMPVEI